jgi:biotin synthase
MPARDAALPRHDWTLAEVEALFDLPFTELVFQAASVHRRWFDPSEVQLSQLLSVKTGGCVENCGYCSQSSHFDTGLKASKLMETEAVIAEAARAKAGGAQRFCMGAAWRDLKDRDVPKVAAMIAGVKALGLETCATLGMLEPHQAKRAEGGGPRLLQPQPRHRAGVLRQGGDHPHLPGPAGHAGGGAQRRHQRLLRRYRRHGRDAARPGRPAARAGHLPEHPDSLPINDLMPIKGTPLGDSHAGGRAGVRAHHRGGADRLPQGGGAAVGRSRAHEPRAAGAVLPGRRQLDLRRRPGC